MVSERLNAATFEKEEALNFDLLAHILDNQNSGNKDKLAKIVAVAQGK